jgi:hypothetical protein
MANRSKIKIKKLNSLLWVADLLSDQPSFCTTPMFGCLAVYVHGSLVLALADKKDPWKGLLVCTSREFHQKLQKQVKGLAPHTVLGKWLYAPSSSKNFEEIVRKIISKIENKDPSIGVSNFNVATNHPGPNAQNRFI